MDDAAALYFHFRVNFVEMGPCEVKQSLSLAALFKMLPLANFGSSKRKSHLYKSNC